MHKHPRIALAVSALMFTALLSGLSLSRAALAQPAEPRWARYQVPAAAEPLGAAHFLDPQSMTRSGTVRQLWTLLRPAKPVKVGKQDVHAWANLIEVDCAAKADRGLLEVGYGPDGGRLYRVRSAAPLEPIPPDSLQSARMRVACDLP